MLTLLAAAALAHPFDAMLPKTSGAWVTLSPDGEVLAWRDDADPTRVMRAPAHDEADATALVDANVEVGQPLWVDPAHVVVAHHEADGLAWWVHGLDGSAWPVGEGTVAGAVDGAVLVVEDRQTLTAIAVDGTPSAPVQFATPLDAWIVDADGAPAGGFTYDVFSGTSRDGIPYRTMMGWTLVGTDGQLLREGGNAVGYPNDGHFDVPRTRAVDGAVIAIDGRRSRPTDVVVRIDLATGDEEELFTSPGANITHLLVAEDGRLLAVALSGSRVRWQALDPEVAADIDRLNALDVDVVVTSAPESPRWLLRARSSTTLEHQLVYDRATGEIWRVGPRYGEAFEDTAWRPKIPIDLQASDGLPLTAYLTLPDGDGPHPLIVDIHGGPWPARDRWMFEPGVQHLAARGYAVLQVNFRGSDGFGRAFHEAWQGEWGGKMQTDVYDALDHVMARYPVDPDRVAVTGASYGGYAALQALVQAPDRFACGVAASGPSVLKRIRGVPSFYHHLGSRKVRRARSPALHVDRLQAPVLMLHGGADLIVPEAYALPFAEAADKAGADVTYVRFADSGHGPTDADADAWFGVRDAFLTRCLGGPPADVDPAALDVVIGGAWLPR